MTQEEVWPVEFTFPSTDKEEESSKEETDTSRCILCDFDHSSSECPNTIQAHWYCGGIGREEGSIRHQRRCGRPQLGLPITCYFCGICHPAEAECTLKWQEQFPDNLTISKEESDTLTQEMIQETEEELCHLCRA